MGNSFYPASVPTALGKIGVFDSGVGGLTVLREIMAELPGESVIYFGDTARVPYGERSASEILRFVREIITWMLGQGVKMVVMACNTSSALALEQVQAEFEIPILGVILPGARAAVKAGCRIGVIATPATAASNAYRQAILEVNPAAQVWQVGCPQFVPLIEQGRILDPHTQRVAEAYIQPLLTADIDTLVYGCTHYPHLEPVLRRFVPQEVTLIDPAKSLVRAIASELKVLGLRNPQPMASRSFYVSGQPSQFARVSRQWLNFEPRVEAVDLKTLAALETAHLKSGAL